MHCVFNFGRSFTPMGEAEYLSMLDKKETKKSIALSFS